MGEMQYSFLSELVTESRDGDWGKIEPEQNHAATHVIRGTDFSQVRFGNTDGVPLRYISDKSIDRRRLVHNDILIETAGGSRDRPTGRTVLISDKLLDRFPGGVTCASFARFLRVDASLANPRYIYWYLQYLHACGRMWVHQVQHTGVARFQYTRFARTEQIPLPVRSAQDAIADFLGVLDDKIAVNERIARCSFELIETEVRGRLEAACQDVELGSIIRLRYGKSLPNSKRSIGEVPVYGSGGISGYHNESLVDGPGAIVGRKGTVGSVYWSERGYFPIDTVFYVEAVNERIPIEVAFFLLRELGLDRMNSDSAVPGLNRKNVEALNVRIPEDSELRMLHEKCRSAFALIEEKEAESRVLAQLRNILLPKLMSDEIRVRDAEETVEEAT